MSAPHHNSRSLDSRSVACAPSRFARDDKLIRRVLVLIQGEAFCHSSRPYLCKNRKGGHPPAGCEVVQRIADRNVRATSVSAPRESPCQHEARIADENVRATQECPS